MKKVTGLVKAKCHICKKIFQKRRRLNQRFYFCSNKCQGKWYSQIRKSGKLYPCVICKRPVYRTKGGIKSTGEVMCSISCFHKWEKGKFFSPKSAFKKGHKPFNKGKSWEKLFGKEKAEELRKNNREKGLEMWSDLKMRRKLMKHKTPKKMKKFRDAGKKYRESKENRERLKVFSNKRRVLDKIMNGSY